MKAAAVISVSCLLVFLFVVAGASLQWEPIKDPGRLLVAGKQLIVGSTNALRGFDIDTFGQGSLLRFANLTPTAERALLCKLDAASVGASECFDFPKVLSLLPNRTDAFLYCGTNALKPRCQYRSRTNLSYVMSPSIPESDQFSRCPYDKDTTNLAADFSGVYYSASHMNPGTDFAWIKLNQMDDPNSVRTMKSNNFINKDAVFSKLFEDEYHVYLAFSETGLEQVSPTVVSRLARVCKNDTGTEKNGLAHRHSFLTFLKARLVCSTQSGYIYNELVSFSEPYTLNNESYVLGVFNNKNTGPPASAMCVYKWSDIFTAFNGGRKRNMMTSAPDIKFMDNTPNCVDVPKEFDALNFNLLENPLTQQGDPLEVKYMDSVSDKYRTLFILRNVAFNGAKCILAVIGTESSTVRRAILCGRDFHWMSDLEINSSGPVTEIVAYQPEDKFQTKLFLLSQSRVTSLLVYGCSYGERSDCVSDLLCGWNCERSECTRRPEYCTESSCDDLETSPGSCPGPPTDVPLKSNPPLNTGELFVESEKPNGMTGEPVEPTILVEGLSGDGEKGYDISVIIGVGIGCGLGAMLIGTLLGLGLMWLYRKRHDDVVPFDTTNENTVKTIAINGSPMPKAKNIEREASEKNIE